MSCTKSLIENDFIRPSFVPLGASSGEMRCLKTKAWCSDSWFAIYLVRYFYCWIAQANWLMILTIAYITYSVAILISHLHNRYSFKAAELFADDFKMTKFMRGVTITLAVMALPELVIGGLMNYGTSLNPNTFIEGSSGIFACIFYALVLGMGMLIKDSLQLDASKATYILACFSGTYGAYLIFCFANFPYIVLAVIFLLAYAGYVFLLYLQVEKNGGGSGEDGGGNQEPLNQQDEETGGDKDESGGETGESGGGGNSGGQNKELKDLNEFLSNIVEIVKEEWNRKNVVSKILFVPLIPIVVLFWLTIPTPDPKKYKRVSWLIYPILGTFLVILAFKGHWSGKVTFGDDTRVLTFFVVLPIALVFGILMYCLSKDGKPTPVLHSFFSLTMLTCWMLYLVKFVFDVEGWDCFNKDTVTSQFFGAIVLGFVLYIRHVRSIRDALKDKGKEEVGLLIVKYGFFSSIFSMIIFFIVGYLIWMNKDTQKDSPRFHVFNDIFDTRSEFFLFVIFFAVLYRAIDLLTMKWRVGFKLEKMHKYFGWHIFAFYLILIVVLDNLVFSK